MLKTINQPLQGTTDVLGLQLRKFEFICRSFSDIANRFGYEQLKVPFIERSSSFSEEIVGKSPWPEWDKRGCFYLTVHNYFDSFENEPSQEEALLIPEGTISVTRWLGKVLDENPNLCFPLKIYYQLPCFRNELLNSLSATKKREFNQFGLEILGSSNIMSDVEIIFLVQRMLSDIGIDRKNIIIRLSNVKIFNLLIEESYISEDDAIKLKETMDTIAECKAGKKPERKVAEEIKFWSIIDKYLLSERLHKCWEEIINSTSGVISKMTYSIFSEKYSYYFNELNTIQEQLESAAVNVFIDLCVVRSHEYYTGISFEVDVLYDDKRFFEIAGGGRYDKLVSNFVNKSLFDKVPSTGFAFGIERVISMLDDLNIFPEYAIVSSNISFKKSSADYIINSQNGKNMVENYLMAIQYIENQIPKDRFDIYLGDSIDLHSLENYKKSKNIELIIEI